MQGYCGKESEKADLAILSFIHKNKKEKMGKVIFHYVVKLPWEMETEKSCRTLRHWRNLIVF